MPSPHPLPHTRTPTLLFPNSVAASRYVAREIDKLVRARNAAGKATVLGLATGSTPVGLYRELIRLHTEEGLDLSRVVTFNLDEYLPMPKEDPHSYFRWMHETFFNHVNIDWHNIHIPDGTLAVEEIDDFCADYEKKIKAAGGVDIQILGIGRTGHIGFNEPGSPRNSRTRMATLDSITRRDAASGFFGEENVPNQAITMGVASILDARRVFLMAFGEHKAPTVVKAVEQVRDMKTAEAAIGVIRGELPKLRKLRERLPESLPAGPTLPPATVEFLEAMVRLTDAEIRVIEAARDRRLPIADGAFDQILMELRRYTDELHHIRNRIAPTPA